MKVSSNRITDVFRHYLEVLEDRYALNESKSFLYILFEHFFNISKLDFVNDPDARLTESEMLKVHFAVNDLLKYKPIQYITGSVNFCGFKFTVTEDVLIPRPETEELVEMILSDNKKNTQVFSILDIGCGSGCIAISLKNNIKNSLVYGIDVSEAALKIASENAAKNHSDVKFKQIDILDVGETDTLPQFDLIVSNPPYVRESEKTLMSENVLDFEPGLALFVSDEDPLIFYRSIARFALSHLAEDGKVYLEINENLSEQTKALFEDLCFTDIEVREDIHGKKRFILASLPK